MSANNVCEIFVNCLCRVSKMHIYMAIRNSIKNSLASCIENVILINGSPNEHGCTDVALQEFPKVFKQIEFAVYCPPGGSRNYDVFRSAFG